VVRVYVVVNGVPWNPVKKPKRASFGGDRSTENRVYRTCITRLRRGAADAVCVRLGACRALGSKPATAHFEQEKYRHATH
jgi:hypothetical protein